jgi:hypothetical protein
MAVDWQEELKKSRTRHTGEDGGSGKEGLLSRNGKRVI